jgi:hypothetical protein
LLLAAIRQSTNTNTLDTVTDTLSNSWTILGRYGATSGRTGYVAYCIANGSGACTVTFNQSVSEAGHSAVAEFTLSGTGALDLDDLTGASTAQASAGTDPTSNARTPTASTGGAISVLIASGNCSPTAKASEVDVTGVTATRLHIFFEAFASVVAQQHDLNNIGTAWAYPILLFSDVSGSAVVPPSTLTMLGVGL